MVLPARCVDRFRAKYHPEECSKKKEFAAKALRARCDAFTKLLENGTVAKVSCDTDKNEALVRLMDAGNRDICAFTCAFICKPLI